MNRTDEAAAIEQQLSDEGPIGDPRTLALYLSTRREDSVKASISPDVSSRSVRTSSRSTRWHGRWLAAGQIDEASALMTRALAEGTEDGRLFSMPR